MAKTKMLCPFSKKLCKECAVYRGKHYFLCFQNKYRGYLGEGVKDSNFKNEPFDEKKFEFLKNIHVGKNCLVFNGFEEGREL